MFLHLTLTSCPLTEERTLAMLKNLFLPIFVGLSVIRECHLLTSCQDGWVPFQGSCYYFGRNHRMNFVTAETYCRQHNANLVHVNNALENNFLKNHLSGMAGSEHYWLGISDENIEGSWQFYGTDTYVTFTCWYPGQPDTGSKGQGEDCAALLKNYDFKWNDYQCSSAYEPICEKSGESEVVG